MTLNSMNVIFTYSRQEAIEDEEQTCVSELYPNDCRLYNCVGVMGKGLALQFKLAFPENFKQYQKACDAKEVQPGQIFIIATAINNLRNWQTVID